MTNKIRRFARAGTAGKPCRLCATLIGANDPVGLLPVGMTEDPHIVEASPTHWACLVAARAHLAAHGFTLEEAP